MRGLKFVLGAWAFAVAIISACWVLIWVIENFPTWLFFGTLFLTVSAFMWWSVEND